MEWITPKLDWQATDDYDCDSLNRVEQNTQALYEIVKRFAPVPNLNFKTDRFVFHIEFADSLNRIEQNLSTLAKHKPAGWIPPKLDWQANDVFSYQDANRLESNVNVLYQHYWNNALIFKYCGNYTCGEGVV